MCTTKFKFLTYNSYFIIFPWHALFEIVFDNQALQSPDCSHSYIFVFIQDAIIFHCHVSIQDLDEKATTLLSLCSYIDLISHSKFV